MRKILARRIKNLETLLTSLRWFLLRPPFSFFVYLGFWWCVAVEHRSSLLTFWTVSQRNQAQPHPQRVPLVAEGGNIPTCHQVGTLKTPQTWTTGQATKVRSSQVSQKWPSASWHSAAPKAQSTHSELGEQVDSWAQWHKKEERISVPAADTDAHRLLHSNWFLP